MRDPFPRAAALALALVAASTTGCKRSDKGPDCKAVAAAYATLQRKEIDKPVGADSTAQQKEQALSLIPLLKEAMVKECEERKWDATTRRCVVEAATPDDLERCRTRAEGAAPEADAPPGAQGAAEGAAPAAAPDQNPASP
jgi:hypothetical protein